MASSMINRNGSNGSVYDVCIVGGGAGGVACGYALKESGLSVCLIEQLDSLGGTHTNAGVIQFLASPAPSFFKDIAEELSQTPYFRWDIHSFLVGEERETQFERLWRGAMINYSGEERVIWGNCFSIHPEILQEKYRKDLSETIELKFRSRVIECSATQGHMTEILVENMEDRSRERIRAHYFVDASGDGFLCRQNGELDRDFFLGADPKMRYRESAISEGFTGNHQELNSLEPTYLICEKEGFESDMPTEESKEASNKNSGKDIEGISQQVNNIWIYPGTEGKIRMVSPDWHAGLKPWELAKEGYDTLYQKGEAHARAHFNARFTDGKEEFLGIAKLLAIRESYRIKCDRMLTQQDVEQLACVKDMVENHCVALSSWYCDIHNPVSVTKKAVRFRQLFGIPYECLIPSAFENVLVACKALGASHVAVSSCRLTKTIMCLGYCAGKAIMQAKKRNLPDVRQVDIVKLQADCGVLELAKDLEQHFQLR